MLSFTLPLFNGLEDSGRSGNRQLSGMCYIEIQGIAKNLGPAEDALNTAHAIYCINSFGGNHSQKRYQKINRWPTEDSCKKCSTLKKQQQLHPYGYEMDMAPYIL